MNNQESSESTAMKMSTVMFLPMSNVRSHCEVEMFASKGQTNSHCCFFNLTIYSPVQKVITLRHLQKVFSHVER